MLRATLVSGSLSAQYHANQIDGVPGAEFPHDPGAMVFDGARADAQNPASFLGRCAMNALCQHFMLPAGQ